MSFFYKFRHFFVLILFIVIFFSARELAAYAKGASGKIKCCVAIDAGHGGPDPGKVGINGELEKDVNLAIALKLSEMLEKKGFSVILTRTTTDDLASGSADNRKLEDLQNRVALIEKSKADYTVSIHQNSFTDSSVCGPQTFYYSESESSKEFAAIIQQSLDSILDTEKSRGIKANSDYYLFRKNPTPTVIVECGFLSNPTEAKLLTSDEYQNTVAKAIYNGIIDYWNSQH